MTELYDIHCHILPGVDDGAKDMQMSLEMLRREYEDGVRTVILTPHYRRSMFETPTQVIEETYEELCREVRKAGIRIRLALGREQYIDSGTGQRLKTESSQTMAGSRYVLCEFSYGTEFEFIRDQAYGLRSSGYIPMLAHIERYKCLLGKFDEIDELAELGCRIQVNAGSILGEDGFRVKSFCRKLIKYDMLDFIGSDAHNLRERRPLLGQCSVFLEKLAGAEYVRRIMQENPSEIMA